MNLPEYSLANVENHILLCMKSPNQEKVISDAAALLTVVGLSTKRLWMKPLLALQEHSNT